MNHLPVVQMNAATLRVLCRQPGRETVRERNRALQGLLRTKTPGRNVREVTSDQPSASSICNQQEKNRAMRSFKWHSHPCKWQNKKIKKKKRITTTTTTTTTVDNKNTVNSASKSQLRQRRLIKQGSFNIYPSSLFQPRTSLRGGYPPGKTMVSIYFFPHGSTWCCDHEPHGC